MKQTFKLLILSLVISVSSISLYHYFTSSSTEKQDQANLPWKNSEPQLSQIPTAFNDSSIEETSFTAAAKQSLDAVVHVKNVSIARQRSVFGFGYSDEVQERKYIRGAGSGVIVSPDGYIVTNNHVIEGATEVDVTLNNNETFKAEVIGTAPGSDIALLKIDRTDLNYLSFGDSDAVEVGEWVLAIGNPFNLTSTVTAGIISAKARDLDPTDNMFQSFIQTDAAVNPGNSGGALVNTNGELIGINTAISSKTGAYIGYSFAIPSNNAKKIIDDLIEYGSIKQAVLGVNGVDINEKNYEELNLNITQGFYVNGFTEDSAAKKSGLKSGDVIIKIDQIKVRKLTDLKGYLNTKNPGDKVLITYSRDGNQKVTEVNLIVNSSYIIKDIALEVKNLEKSDRKSFDGVKGVKVSKALAEDYKFFEGMVITQINRKDVNSIDDVKQIMQSRNSSALLVSFLTKDGKKDTYVFR